MCYRMSICANHPSLFIRGQIIGKLNGLTVPRKGVLRILTELVVVVILHDDVQDYVF